MKLNSREQEIIRILLEKQTYLTADTLAQVIGVSAKTIYRSVVTINEKAGDISLIESEKSKGYQLDADKYYQWNKQTENQTEIPVTPSARRKEVILALLFAAPNTLKVQQLYAKYFLSESSQNKDLVQIEVLVSNAGLKLIRKKDTLAITGTEADIRQYIYQLLQFVNFLSDEIVTFNDLTVNSFDYDRITRELEVMEEKLNYSIIYPYNVNIFCHLYILVNRLRKGQVKFNEKNKLSEREQELIKDNRDLFEIARETMNNLEGYVHVALSRIETFYLFQYIISSRGDDGEVKMKEDNQTKKITNYFVALTNRAFGRQVFAADRQSELESHINPLLYRVANNIKIQNSLLPEIKQNYQTEFLQVKKTVINLENKFKLKAINEDEIGFLTLYVVKSLAQTQRKLNVLIMCSSGIGTSELLKVKVERSFPDLNIVDVLAYKKYLKQQKQYKEVDLIISTTKIPAKIKNDIIQVSAIFTESDQQRLKTKLEAKTHGQY